jgi:hypothetical protein
VSVCEKVAHESRPIFFIKQQIAQDNKIIFFFFFFFFSSLLCKTLMMFLLRKHCKEGASVVTYFWVPIKMRKYKKKKVYIKRNPKNNRSEKRMLKCRRKVKIGLGGAKMQKVKI